MAWDRLEQCYGTPEASGRALFTRLENFPKISNRDVQKLADLLLEIEAAKEDCFLPELSYLDTARGIHHILEKLPYHLQDKWTSYGSKYKEQHQICLVNVYPNGNRNAARKMYTILNEQSKLFKQQWKQVQSLADTFWERWR
ncbi:hypothetical protein L3Q82_012092, partial [Scortum barcoo]